jgi:hypothetical protein
MVFSDDVATPPLAHAHLVTEVVVVLLDIPFSAFDRIATPRTRCGRVRSFSLVRVFAFSTAESAHPTVRLLDFVRILAVLALKRHPSLLRFSLTLSRTVFRSVDFARFDSIRRFTMSTLDGFHQKHL